MPTFKNGNWGAQVQQHSPGTSFLNGMAMRVAFDQQKEDRSREIENERLDRMAGVAKVEADKKQQKFDNYMAMKAEARLGGNASKPKDPNIIVRESTLPDGTEVRDDYRLDRSDTTEGAGGSYKKIPKTTRLRRTQSMTGTPEQFASKSDAQLGKDLSTLQGSAVAIRAMVPAMQQLVDDIHSNPLAFNTTGAIIRSMDSVGSMAAAVGEQTGLWVDPTGPGVQQFFREHADISASAQPRFMNLTLMWLAAKGQTGKAVSNEDMNRFYGGIGASTNSPGQLHSSMSSVLEDVYTEYSANLAVKGTPFPKENPDFAGLYFDKPTLNIPAKDGDLTDEQIRDSYLGTEQ